MCVTRGTIESLIAHAKSLINLENGSSGVYSIVENDFGSQILIFEKSKICDS